MPKFNYTALTREGVRTAGALDAANPNVAAGILRQQSLFVVKIEAAGTAPVPNGDQPVESVMNQDVSQAFRFLIRKYRPVLSKDRVFLFRQLALMIRSGLTLLQALEVCKGQVGSLALSNSLQRIIDGIQAGKSLSQSMSGEGKLYSAMTVKLLESAEASGELDEVLEQIALHLEEKANLKMNLLTSIIYPSVVVLTAIGVAIFLTWKVIPKFAAFFARRQSSLPPSTQLLMDVSSLVSRFGLLFCVLAVIAVVGLILLYKTPRGRIHLDAIILKVPVIGPLLMIGEMAQFGRSLSMLLSSGLTLLDSLKIVAGTLDNKPVSILVENAANRILAGQDLANSLKSNLLPPLVTQVVAVGEKTGALSEVLRQLGDFYDKELQTRIKRMSALIEPVTILVIGSMVGFVYYAFFQALFQMASGR